MYVAELVTHLTVALNNAGWLLTVEVTSLCATNKKIRENKEFCAMYKEETAVNSGWHDLFIFSSFREYCRAK